MSQTATSAPKNGLKGLAIERRFSNLELNHKHNGADEQNGIDPPTHSRDVKFQEQRTDQPDEMALQKTYLHQPCILLRCK